LLSRLASSFDIMVSGVPEPVDPLASVSDNVLALARAKATAVASLVPDCLVLAADTDVAIDGRMLGKPGDAAEAAAMLRQLRGRWHEVATGVVLFDPGSGEMVEEVEVSRVHLRDLTDVEIDAYVATGEPLDKAGGYAIQGRAASMVDAVIGCYTNVVGLPLCVASRLLSGVGFPVERTVRCEHDALRAGWADDSADPESSR
jgi:septum formation protein